MVPWAFPTFTETTKVIAPVMANMRDRTDRRVHPTATKTSRDMEEVPVHNTTVRSRALLRVNLCHLCPCSIPLPYRHCAGCLPDLPEPSSAHLSFNQSRSSLPPLDLGGSNAHPILSVGMPIQGGTPSIVGPLLPSTSTPTVKFSEDHIKQIFSLACEGWHLKECITWEFIRLSSQEVLFHTQVQSTSHEALAQQASRLFHNVLWDIAVWPTTFGSKRQGYGGNPQPGESGVVGKQMRHYSSTYWIMRLNWKSFWTKLGVGSGNKRSAFGQKCLK